MSEDVRVTEIKVAFTGGANVRDCAIDMQILADVNGCPVRGLFNGTPIECYPGDDADSVARRWELGRTRV